MERIDLKDVTFLIPFRIDSVIRLENLQVSVEVITKYFDTKISVLEADEYNNTFAKRIMPKGVKYSFWKDNDPIFYRTKYINVLAGAADTQYVAIWDTDIIISPRQIIQAVALLRKHSCDVVFPYDGRFCDTTPIIRNMFLKNKDLQFLERHIDKMLLPYGSQMVGGAIFIDKERYIAAGGENEHFYGWGPEDWERVERWKKCGYQIMRSDGPLFHLSHTRDINGMHSSSLQKVNSYLELHKTKKSYAD